LGGHPVVAAPQPPSQFDLIELSDSFEELSARVKPAVVEVLASGYAAATGIVSSAELLTEQRSRGSGVLVSSEGHIVTNAHVVSGARRVRVLLSTTDVGSSGSILGPRARMVGAQIVGLDLETDLAVLKIDGTAHTYLELGDSDSLRAGELVFAFGSPLGLSNTVTMGVVGASARQLRPEDSMIYIQTDASINPGNSGGPLVNTKGQVVGINTMIVSRSGGSEGLGFAAPANIVRNVFEQIRSTGRVHRGQIGVRAQTITPQLASGLGLSRDYGVILADVYPLGPASRAGLEPGDIVLALDGKPMENGRQLNVNIYQRRVGERVELDVMRSGQTRRVSVVVAERKREPERFASMVHPDRNLVPELGILGIDLTDAVMRMFAGLRRASGVVVAARAADVGPLEGDGLLPGDVIHSVNRVDVGTLAELKQAVTRYAPGNSVVLVVERANVLRYVTLEVY
jgi:serine protease Do